jgi:uncharacterized protein YjbI with pentapeptide repeats
MLQSLVGQVSSILWKDAENSTVISHATTITDTLINMTQTNETLTNATLTNTTLTNTTLTNTTLANTTLAITKVTSATEFALGDFDAVIVGYLFLLMFCMAWLISSYACYHPIF